MSEGPIIELVCADIDYELSEILGEKPIDCLVLCFGGVVFQGYGTPLDSDQARTHFECLTKGINDRSRKSLWPKMWVEWGADLIKQYSLDKTRGLPEEDRPVASYKIQRVCVGYSSHLGPAMGLLDKFPDKIAYWHVGHSGGFHYASITDRRSIHHYREGMKLSETICRAVRAVIVAYREDA